MKYLITCLLVCISTFLPVLAQDKLDTLVMAGPFAAVSNPLIRMIETKALADITDNLKFEIWKNPDQLRAMVLNGKTDFIATPTNVAANLYNRGADIRLLNVSVWGILWMVSREQGLQTLADFKGKEIAMPFRGDMPDLIFTELAEQQGLDPKKDFTLRYVANPLDAMQLLILRRVDHALLAEPAVSMAIFKTKTFPAKIIAPDLYRSVDLQKEWGRLLKREAKIPQAGMAVINKKLNPHVIKRFNEEYEKAMQWCLDHPDEAGKMVAKRVPMLLPEAVTESIKVGQLKPVSAKVARNELEYFFKVLLKRTPALVGGKLPDDGFYSQ
ncbi:MAG: ABC transporter substrate-binding protein [Methylococcaceae bacterium]|nr:ABC transporter substrate-binding protein [Methylococcaceae bacterium]